MRPSTPFSFLLLLPLTAFVSLISLSTAALSGTVEPYPRSDCGASSGIGAGFASCPNSTGCCSSGACCAGGCCPALAMCVNIGQSDEACCPYSSTDYCGAAMPSFTASCVAGPRPSVVCSGVDDSWYCEPGAVCGLTSGSCNNFYTGNDPCESNAAVSESASATGSVVSETGSALNSGSTTASADAAIGTQSQSTQTGAAGRVEARKFGGALAVGLAEVGLGVWGLVVGLY